MLNGKNIINVTIGASTLKIIHCEKRDTDIIVKNATLLETGSNLYLNKEQLNIGFIEDKLRNFLTENKIKNAEICYALPDYIVSTEISNKQYILSEEYISSLIKGKIVKELSNEPIEEASLKVIDSQILKTEHLNTGDENDGITDISVSYIDVDIVKSLKKMSKKLKMKATVLEAEISGLLRLIDMFRIKENYLIVDIGEIYTKIIFICGTETMDIQIRPIGTYKIDGLISSLYRCPKIIATDRRIKNGLVQGNLQMDNIIENVMKEIFSNPILEYLDNIQNNYGGLHYIEKFIITGGAWNIKEFKNTIERQTLEKFGSVHKFEDYSELCDEIIFENESIKEYVLKNINSFASCLGLSLRGGL